jgi:hypothetical protein
MTKKDDSMVGVGKIETIPMHERKFHYLKGVSTLVRCYMTNNRISYVGLKMGVGLGRI